MACDYLQVGMQYWSNNEVWRIDVNDHCDIFNEDSNLRGRVYPKDYEKVLSVLGYPAESLDSYNWVSSVARIQVPILRTFVEEY